LKDIDFKCFKKFFLTVYIIRKLEINKKIKSFATCPDCNKLYDIATIISQNTIDARSLGFKYTHIEFSNHPMQNYHKYYESELLMKIPVNNRYI